MQKNKNSSSEKRMLVSFLLNFFFTIFEIIGGILTGSIALLSDAVHDFGDSVSIGIAIFLERKSKKKPDYKYTYGYYRFSLLGGLISSIILVVGSTLIIYKAVERLFNPEPLLNPQLLIIFAVIGVIINGLAAYNTSKGDSINEKVISLHMLEDVFGWIALLITAIFINIFNIHILDVILSLVFSLYIIIHVFKNLKKIMEVFLEKAPKSPKLSDIKLALMNIDGVLDVHHIHYWTLEGSIPLITLHMVIFKNTSSEEIHLLHVNAKKILSGLGIEHSTIQIDFSGLGCIDDDCGELEVKSNHHH